jgi:UDP-N-acetylmuramoyl-L-alanyl-D-glutamate--2,6-diaminopimelate ligase
VIVVIGAAGERDPGKRTPLGQIAATRADLAIFTEEDSRSEDTDAILAELAAGAATTGARRGSEFLLEPDRRAAIRAAVARARPGDVVLLCGKGHETTLERSAEVLSWNEAEEARAALAHAGLESAPEAR